MSDQEKEKQTKSSKKSWYLAIALTVIVGLWLLAAFRAPASAGYHMNAAAQLPVLHNGRMKPLDSVARNTLLVLYQKQEIKAPKKFLSQRFQDADKDSIRLSASDWMFEMMTSSKINDLPVIRIDHPQVKQLLEFDKKEKYFSFNQLFNFGKKIEQEATLARKKMEELKQNLKPDKNAGYHQAITGLDNKINSYVQLQFAILPGSSKGFMTEVERFRKQKTELLKLMRSHVQGDAKGIDLFPLMRLVRHNQIGALKCIPGETPEDWQTTSASMIDKNNVEKDIHPVIIAYSKMLDAYRINDLESFNQQAAKLQEIYEDAGIKGLAKVHKEFVFNYFQPFYKAMVIYVLVFLLTAFSWLKWERSLRQSAFALLLLTFVVHGGGILARMYIQGYAPVTNLYSSAVFIGFAAVLLSLILEKIYKNGMGNLLATLIGFSTLIIAHHLSLDGDTMEMMQAVLDSNFWLATHVLTITIGYSGTFMAGFLGIIYVIRGLLTTSLDRKTSRHLAGMIYGITCFSLLFSFVGTVLGGIWADVSWGRFWGWDPKENGALMIVIWHAIILHAKWAGYIRERGLALLAIGGNIITAWSWFGVNMLGQGLHSYGFIDKAFIALVAFVISQCAIIAIGSMPVAYWRSGKHLDPEKRQALEEQLKAMQEKEEKNA